jgi:ribonuclease HI
MNGPLEQDDKSGQRRPVAFGGRKLTKAETNYSVTEKECLAVIEALKAYRPYLLAREFDLYTDHQSLKWLLTRTKEHSGRLWCWVDKIQEFQYTVRHIAGTKNTVADALSRIRFVEIESEEDCRSLEYVRK